MKALEKQGFPQDNRRKILLIYYKRAKNLICSLKSGGKTNADKHFTIQVNKKQCVTKHRRRLLIPKREDRNAVFLCSETAPGVGI